jgi:hypothetical protein
MKKKLTILIIIFILFGCTDKEWSQAEKEQNKEGLLERNMKILETYENFLRGKQPALGSIYGTEDYSDEFYVDQINYFTQGDRFTICDANGDGIPDLYLNSTICQVIISYRNEELILLHYSLYADLLSNGAWLYKRLGGAPTYISYRYWEEEFMDFFDGSYSKERFSIEFEKLDTDDGEQYDNDDAFDYFEIEGVEVTREEWNKETAKYFVAPLPVQWCVYPGKNYEDRIIPEDIDIVMAISPGFGTH